MQDVARDEVLATLSASPVRRGFGMVVMYVLGVLLIWLGFRYPPAAFGWQVFLLALGAAVLGLSEMMRRATQLVLELTETELRDSSGTVIASVEQIISISRGAFAMKPSHGFSLHTRRALGRGWRPGVWWRFGRRVGIGGVMPSGQAKVMAEMLAAMVATRDAKD